MAKNDTSGPGEVSSFDNTTRIPRPKKSAGYSSPEVSNAGSIPGLGTGLTYSSINGNLIGGNENLNRVNRNAARNSAASRESNSQLDGMSNLSSNSESNNGIMDVSNNPIRGFGESEDPNYKQTDRRYSGLAGWDIGKLNNANKSNTKYNVGRGIQDFGGIKRGKLQDFVDYYNKTYGGKATVTDDDEVDFGEDYGIIDLINGEGYPQWLVTGRQNPNRNNPSTPTPNNPTPNNPPESPHGPDEPRLPTTDNYNTINGIPGLGLTKNRTISGVY